MTNFIEAGQVFKHHQPLSLESMQGFTIFGTNGAFKNLVKDSGNDPDSLWVGIGVEINQGGEILGTRLLLSGKIPEMKVSTADIFPEAKEQGKIVFQKNDIGNWAMPNGLLTSHWTRREDNALNWAIKVQSGGRTKTIRFPKHSEYGFGDASFRLNVQPTSVSTMKVSLSVAPLGGDDLEKIPNWTSRKFPTISLSNARATIFPKEDEGQHLGLGFQPIFILRGTEPGAIDLETVNYPSSMAVKEAVVLMLQGSTKPNERVNARKWKEAIDNEEFVAEKTTLLWPTPRMEDDMTTSDSTASVDTDGENINI